MNERCMRILDMVREAGSVEVSTLAEALGVSAVTIRKDLAQLEKERLLRRQHGSAVQISSDDVAYRMAFDYGPKRRIAQRAAAMVQNGETVMIESGSTCALLAAELAENRRDVTIVTNSAFIAGYVGRMPGAKTVLLGGNYDPDAQTATGPLVRVCAREFFVDKFFFGTDGFDPAFGFSQCGYAPGGGGTGHGGAGGKADRADGRLQVWPAQRGDADAHRGRERGGHRSGAGGLPGQPGGRRGGVDPGIRTWLKRF